MTEQRVIAAAEDLGRAFTLALTDIIFRAWEQGAEHPHADPTVALAALVEEGVEQLRVVLAGVTTLEVQAASAKAEVLR